MKRLMCFILCAAFVLALPLATYASDDDGVLITVVIPESPQPTSTPDPPATTVFPVAVFENRENNRREIIRVYELWAHESAADISREPFTREGFLFESTEITRQTIPGFSTRDHNEIVTINTQTNDLSAVIGLLAPTLEFTTEDGYFGVLSLDVTTIQMEQAGTRTNRSTITTAREFPHLSAPDMALIPRTVTDRNRTYELTDVQWRQQSGENIDYRDVPVSFTAVATFSRTATSTVVTGYITTAEYRGTVSRISNEVTRYTVYFLGVPIVSPIIAPSTGGTGEAVADTDICASNDYKLANGAYSLNSEEPYCYGYEPDTEDEHTERQNTLLIALIVILSLAVIGLVFFINKARIFGFMSRSKTGKTAAMFLVMLVVAQAVISNAYAAPPYRFGAGQSAVHMDETRHMGNTRNQTGELIVTTPMVYQYGDFLGTLHVERLNRIVRIYAGATMESMDYGASHFSFTGLNTGNTGLIGHNRGSRNGFFSFVRLLQTGDILTLYANGIARSYAVTLQYTISDTDFSPLMAFGDNRLTLITCVEYQPGLRRVAVAIEI